LLLSSCSLWSVPASLLKNSAQLSSSRSKNGSIS
jgi:hypothetical protein